MNKDLMRMLWIAAVLVAITAGAALIYSSQRDTAERAEAAAIAKQEENRFERSHSRSLGPATAKVTLVEFFDPECESCRAVHPVVKQLLKQYPADLRLVMRYMPLHGNSVYAAMALEAAGEQGMYWEMLERLFHYQPIWGNHHDPKPELIPVYADELGLDMGQFQSDVTRPSYRTLVEIDRADGQALGVRGTPTFFVNRRRVLRLDGPELAQMIEQELAKSDAR